MSTMKEAVFPQRDHLNFTVGLVAQEEDCLLGPASS